MLPENFVHGASDSGIQITSLIIEALAWCSMLILIGLETKIYIREFRWYVRSSLYLYISTVCCQVLFGVLLLFYVPILDPYPGYVVLQSESLDNAEYEALPGEVEIFPERHVNIFSRKSFRLILNHLWGSDKYELGCSFWGSGSASIGFWRV